MKMKRAIIRTLIVVMVAMLGIGTILPSLAVTEENKELRLEYFRYINNDYTNGYALNTVGNEGESHHPIFQIMSSTNDTNYYCLNATAGESWLSGTVGATATYNRGYDLNSSSDIDALKNDTNDVYKNIGNSAHLNHILWILDNMYITDKRLSAEQNLAKKRELLAKAGIIYDNVVETVNMQEVRTDNMTYKYVPQTGYNFNDQLFNIKDGNNNSIYGTQETYQGWYYYDTESKFNNVELTDDIVEVAQQAAIWYFTNYLENNSANSETYNVRTQGLNLVCSNGTTETNSHNWKPLEDDTFSVDTDMWEDQANNRRRKASVGKWKQEMATILCWYLIDAANNNASSAGQESTGNPLTIAPDVANINEKKVNNINYYVVGPIKIDETRTAVYTLNNEISVNGDKTTGAYISNAEGNRNSSQTLTDYIGQNIYIAIPKSKVNGNNVQITFDGTYKTNEKKLLVSTTKTEQPVVEVTPKDKPFELKVTAPIQKEFDLALRKVITKITSADGKTKMVINEKGVNAERNVTVDTSTIPNTATYKHRKDPVVVEKGDIVTYSITVYNEGEMAGYAKTIVDELPNGLLPKNEIGTYRNGNVNYSYEFYPWEGGNNRIIFTNVSKNELAPYNGQNTLSSETIEIECEVTRDPSTTTNNYLTNIAYISEAYNTETNQDVVQDRDSSTNNNPSATQNTTGDKYTGYHGGNNNNGDNSKDVYKDGTNNDDYFPGREDDDDFEIVVIKPADFDLALKKYITNVISPDGTMKPGRNAPIINTENLKPNGNETTANYDLDKAAIRVKSGDYVLYTLTAYNEGEVDGYVKKITDNIPTGLEFVYVKEPQDGKTIVKCDSQGNMTEIEVSSDMYQKIKDFNAFWSIDATNNVPKKDTYNGESTISITCDVENAIPTQNGGKIGGGFLKAYDSNKEGNNHDGSGLDRLSVQVLLRVSAPNGIIDPIRNEAAITEATDKDGNIQDVTELKDRDSQTDKWPGKETGDNYQDDEDYDRIILERVDLALTKFITAISDDIKIEDEEYLTENGGKASKENPYSRATKVDTTPLLNGKTDAEYTLDKSLLTVPAESYILYNIRVYNEGDVDVYAGEVKDYLPDYLTFVKGEFNDQYGWNVSSNGKTVTTDYLSYSKNRDKILKAFNYDGTDDGHGSKLDYQDLPILCRISADAPNKTKLVNSAEITKYEDENGNEFEKDIDSESKNLPDDKKNKEGKPEGRYDEDDEDYEVIEVRKKIVDLALTKFIAAVSNDIEISDEEYLTVNGGKGSKENPYTRATKVDTTNLRDDENCHDATYIMIKDPLTVPAKSFVLYNIRVYNEGETDVYAGEVKDHLPDYLDYVDCDFNKNFGWSVASDGKTISTTYLSHESKVENLLKAFDKKSDDGNGSGLDYRDLQVLCRVNDNAPTNTNIVNVADITRYENKDGNPIPEDDIDSRPDNVNEKHEDDDDYEVVLIKKFDLSLLKYVTEVYITEDGKTKTIQTGNTGDDSKDIIPKVEINKKKLNSTIVKFGYTIKITNEGEIEGYAKEITDYVPEGLKFYAEDNNGWTDEGDNVISTRLLENTLLQPGESAEVKVIFRWINGSNNLGLKTNTAEISEDYNKEGVPDIDSTPDNRKPGEDDIDDAKVILSIKTGLVHNIVMYSTIGLIILVVMGTGIYSIKKYVL